MSASNTQKFSVTWRVNGDITYVLENVTAESVWDEAIPDEAMRADAGNRWHVMLRCAALQRMKNLHPGKSFALAWQDDSAVGADTEHISVTRISPADPVDEMAEEIDKLKQDITSATEEITHLEQENDDLRKELYWLRQEYDYLRRQTSN